MEVASTETPKMNGNSWRKIFSTYSNKIAKKLSNISTRLS